MLSFQLLETPRMILNQLMVVLCLMTLSYATADQEEVDTAKNPLLLQTLIAVAKDIERIESSLIKIDERLDKLERRLNHAVGSLSEPDDDVSLMKTSERLDQLEQRLNQDLNLTCYDKTTYANNDGDGNALYLDRHNVDCGSHGFLVKFRLNRLHRGLYQYQFRCCTGKL